MKQRWVFYVLGGAATFAVIAAAAMFLMMLSLGGEVRRGFLGSFEVRNDAGVPVTFTPIGMWEGSGAYGPLPRFEKAAPQGGVDHRFEIPLAAGETTRFTYDADDINFRHLLVRVPDGDLRIVDTDKKGTLHLCYGPQEDTYVIPPLEQMAPASPELEPCARGATVSYSKAVEYPER